MVYIFFSTHSVSACAQHLGRINFKPGSSNITDIFYQSGLISYKKISLKTWVNFLLLYVALFVSHHFFTPARDISYQFSLGVTTQKKILNTTKLNSALYINNYSVSDIDITFMRNYFGNKKRVLNEPSLVRKRKFDITFSPNCKEGNLNKIPGLRLDAG